MRASPISIVGISVTGDCDESALNCYSCTTIAPLGDVMRNIGDDNARESGHNVGVAPTGRKSI